MKIVDEPIPEQLYKKIHSVLPLACVDLVVTDRTGKHFFLVRRKNEPEKEKWWFPGGRIYKNERLKEAVGRKLKQESGLQGVIKKQLGVYEYFSDKGYFKGTNSHMIAVVFLVRADAGKDVTLDWQSTDSQWFSRVDPSWHSYLKEFLKKAGFKEI